MLLVKSVPFLEKQHYIKALMLKYNQISGIIFAKVNFPSYRPIFTDNVPPIVTPRNPPTVNMDTIVDQSRVRMSSDIMVS